jgi:hypothetical protein
MNFTAGYIASLFRTMDWLRENGHTALWHNHASADIYVARNFTIYDVNIFGNKPNPQPFDGDDYDYILWLDSDIIWEPEDLQLLIDDDKDVVCGMVPISLDGTINVGWNMYGGIVRAKPVAFQKDLSKVDYTGWAYVLVKKGVFEKLEYPYFSPWVKETVDGIRIPVSEDHAFCKKLRDGGFKIYVDKRVKAKHQHFFTVGLPDE